MILNKHCKISPCRAIHDIEEETMRRAQHVLDVTGVVHIGDIHVDEASYSWSSVSIEGVVVEVSIDRNVFRIIENIERSPHSCEKAGNRLPCVSAIPREWERKTSNSS